MTNATEKINENSEKIDPSPTESREPTGFQLVFNGERKIREATVQNAIGLHDFKKRAFFPGKFGWYFRDKEDAEKVAEKCKGNGSEAYIFPSNNQDLIKVWNGNKQEARNARERIRLVCNRLKNSARVREIEQECKQNGLNPSFLSSDLPPDELDDKEKSLFNYYKPYWNEARNEAVKIEIQEKDNAQEREDLEALPSDDKEAIVEELNRKHAFVHTDASHILTEKPHAFLRGVMDFVLESRQSFLHAYENQRVDNKNTKAHIWLSHPLRRSFPNGITFDPSTTGHTNGFYNLWGGFAYSPKQGSCELFKAHIQNVICSRNSSYFEYVWKWCAYVFQHPDRVHTALLLMGSQGTGKGVFVKALGALFGKHFIHLDSVERLVGNFNFHMKNAVLVFADEAVWGGNRKDVGRLKAMITEELALIEPKGKDSIPIRNFRHFIFSSNEDWPVHLDRDDRRFFVLKVSDAHKEDFTYFERISEELRNGGYEALLHELLNTDLMGFDPRQMPSNIDSFSVKLESAHDTQRYIFEALKAGRFDIGNSSPIGRFLGDKVLTSSIYTDYKSWCHQQEISPRQENELGKAICKCIPSTSKSRSRALATDQVSQPYIYIFPSLEKARKEFEQAYKVGSEIWEDLC